MKQKNLIMLGVAVGCGLVAAVAVAKLSAKPDGPELVRVLVAKKDIPIRTKLEEKELENWVDFAEMPRNVVVPDAMVELDKVKNQRVGRTLKKGNVISQGDLGASEGITVPEGFKHFTLRTTQAALVGGFALPGSMVDVMLVERRPDTQGRTSHRAGIIMKDMLVLAVNDRDSFAPEKDSTNAIKQVESVSLAVTDRQAARLALCDERGSLKFILKNSTTNSLPSKVVIEERDIEWVEYGNDGPRLDVSKPDPNLPKLDTVVVAKQVVPLNTLVNRDNAKEYFAIIEVKVAPEGGVRSVDELLGKFMVNELRPGQFIFKNLSADKPKEVVKPVEVVKVEPKVEPKAPPKKVEVPRLKKFEQVIVESGTIKTILWAEVAPDKWKRFENEQALENYKPETDK